MTNQDPMTQAKAEREDSMLAEAKREVQERSGERRWRDCRSFIVPCGSVMAVLWGLLVGIHPFTIRSRWSVSHKSIYYAYGLFHARLDIRRFWWLIDISGNGAAKRLARMGRLRSVPHCSALLRI